MKRRMTRLLQTGLLVGALSSPAIADTCIGSVVNGQCFGHVQRDYSQPGSPPATFFFPNQQGVPTSPTPGPAWNGSQFENRTMPVMPGGQLQWANPYALPGMRR